MNNLARQRQIANAPGRSFFSERRNQSFERLEELDRSNILRAGLGEAVDGVADVTQSATVRITLAATAVTDET